MSETPTSPESQDPGAGATKRAINPVEVLIVTIILGLLAVVVVPRLSNAANTEREGTLRDNLHYLRTQVLVYKAQHQGVSPGYPGGDVLQMPSEEVFVAQMTQYTNEVGQTSATPSAEFQFGPYFQHMPVNPLNNSGEIRFIDSLATFPVEVEGEQGWAYQPSSGTLIANTAGVDIQGVSYTAY
jgi:general secretion pathway protein G